jgi:prepilin-type N-terminal cleavage/methylation domain-containing protein
MTFATKKWFTLIEMMIVVVIIWILAAAIIPRVTWAQAQSRDTARLADLGQMGTALIIYEGTNGSLPATTPTNNNATTSLAVLISDNFIKSIPKDPKQSNVGFCGSDTSSTTTSASYGYMRLDSNTNFVLIADTEVSKKWNRLPMASGTGCIVSSVTLPTLLSRMLTPSVITTQGTRYIYAD